MRKLLKALGERLGLLVFVFICLYAWSFALFMGARPSPASPFYLPPDVEMKTAFTTLPLMALLISFVLALYFHLDKPISKKAG